MREGAIQRLVPERGFGFIQPVEGGDEVFFHCSAVDAPWESLSHGQSVQYELDAEADKPRAKRVVAGAAGQSSRSQRGESGQAGGRRFSEASRPAEAQAWEQGFVTKLHRKQLRGFISSVKHGPEFVFAAESVTGKVRFARLEIGDYVQFRVGEPDPEQPKQPVAVAVQVVNRKVNEPDAKRVARHPRARGKKPTWR